MKFAKKNSAYSNGARVYIKLSRKRVLGCRLDRKKRYAAGFGYFRDLKNRKKKKVHRQEVLFVIRHREIQRLVKARRLRSSFNSEVYIKLFSLIVRDTV